ISWVCNELNRNCSSLLACGLSVLQILQRLQSGKIRGILRVKNSRNPVFGFRLWEEKSVL
ncbi:hypothetical protein, partial [Neisseria shayeganii]|uniref:hypothetical protein n=1 Tax=Neisseria shayeganii TaxID=607712 RepID=UPI001E2FC28F